MKWPLVTMAIESERDIVAIRQRAKHIADHLGFSLQEQTRIATALSEIARNALGYAGGGKVEYGVHRDAGADVFMIRVSDRGGGIADLQNVLDGRYVSATGMGVGLTGARRLLDRLDIDTAIGKGTRVTLVKRLPSGSPSFTTHTAAAIVQTIGQPSVTDAFAMMRDQNHDLLQSLAALSDREEETRRLNRELEDTNRGVVALYAELESTADQLRIAGETLESTVAERTAELARSNTLLKAEAEARERMEDDLRQAQKMEAIGQLTGGIAHDFNNLLTGIVGSLDMMRRRIKQNRLEKLDAYIELAMNSAERASALTHRLLAFARRQPLNPKATEVNGLILGMDDLLSRTISEAIMLETRLASEACLTVCDPHQLENAILNLVINARDAMPKGGVLTVGTSLIDLPSADLPVSSAPPGRYVCIAVADTGTGMPPDVIARAFDPFFTTKPLGQGTGLGLSMIYGFARQSGGHALIASEMGCGTTMRIFLPFVLGCEDRPEMVMTSAVTADSQGETILVVEDEAVVRNLVVEALMEAGYVVYQAIDGPSGLRQLQSAATVDLVVTDVGLPNLNGRQMADAARETRPDLKVLFMTGYAEGATTSAGFLDPGMALITKPFSIDTLLSNVRDMLDPL